MITKLDIITKYRPIVISKKKYLLSNHYVNNYSKLPTIQESILSNLSTSLLNPFDYIDSHYFNLSHQQQQKPLLIEFSNKNTSDYIILHSILSHQNIKHIYSDTNIDALKNRLSKNNNISYNTLEIFDDTKRKDEILIFINNLDNIFDKNFWKNKDGTNLVISFQINKLELKTAYLLNRIMELSDKSYIEVPPNYINTIYIVIPNMYQNFHQLYNNIDSNAIISYELSSIFEKVIIILNNLTNSRNKYYPYGWEPADAEYVSAVNLNYCYSICKKYGLVVNPEYLNQFNQLREIKLIYSRYITKYFPTKSNINKSLLQISNVGLYSITKPYVTTEVINIMKHTIETVLHKTLGQVTITDGTAGIGGDTIAFCEQFEYVNAVEIIKVHADIIKNNLDVYQFNNYRLHHDNYLTVYDRLKQDIVYLDSPWGGVGYKEQKYTELYMFGSDLTFNDFVHKLIAKNDDIVLFIKCPINYNVFKLSQDLYKINMDKNLKVSFVSNFLLLTIY